VPSTPQESFLILLAAKDKSWDLYIETSTICGFDFMKIITEINHNLVERLPSMTSEKKQRKKNATARRTPIFLHGKTGFMFTVQVFQQKRNWINVFLVWLPMLPQSSCIYR